MSRSGKRPIDLPSGVELSIQDRVIKVKGPKGTLDGELFEGVEVAVEPRQVTVSSPTKVNRLHGLQRALIHNMVVGTSQGFQKKLELVGVGFRANVKGNMVELQLGFSHPTALAIPTGLSVAVEKNTVITVSGIDKQAVGQFAAEIRSLRPPEPYKGKGVRYQGEYVRKKAGKSAK